MKKTENNKATLSGRYPDFEGISQPMNNTAN